MTNYIWIFLALNLVAGNSAPLAQAADSLTLDTVVACKTPTKNPVAQKIRVYVRKGKDGRLFAQVEKLQFGGLELRAHSLVAEKKAEGAGQVPVTFEGPTVKLQISDKTYDGGWFGGGSADYKSQVTYTTLDDSKITEAVGCQIAPAR